MAHVDPRIPRLTGGFPGVGHLFALRRDRLGFLERMQKVGPVAAARLGPIDALFVSEPGFLQAILVERAYDFHKGRNYAFFARLVGQGLVTSEDELHKRQRKLAAPAFTARRIGAYADTMAQFAEDRQAAWRDGAALDLATEMHQLTLDIAAKTLFDANVGDASRLGEAFVVASRWVIEETVTTLHWPYHWPTPRHARMRRTMAHLHTVIDALIAERRQSGRDQGDMLSMLIAAKDEAGQGMSDVQLRDEVLTLLFAGHETTANALVWAFYLLGRNPEALARLQAESDKVLGGRVPAQADLPLLPFALRVFKEALRLYPPAYVMSRTAMRDMEVGSYHVEAGQHVAVNVWGLHRRADFYPDPERFDPDRFLPEREKALPRHAYLPFVAGPRVCIGNHFALMEGQLILAHLAQRVTLKVAAETKAEPDPLITLRAKHGLPVLVERRSPASRVTA